MKFKVQIKYYGIDEFVVDAESAFNAKTKALEKIESNYDLIESIIAKPALPNTYEEKDIIK